MNSIEWYLKQGLLVRDNSFKVLGKKFLEKAKQNLITMSLLFDLNDKKARIILKVPKDYDSSEWVVISGYYAMYTAALALLAKVGFKSKNHAITLLALEEFFVKKKILDDSILLLLKNARFQKDEIEKLSGARHKREIAQYSITKHTTKDLAKRIKADAYDFVNKIELLFGK